MSLSINIHILVMHVRYLFMAGVIMDVRFTYPPNHNSDNSEYFTWKFSPTGCGKLLICSVVHLFIYPFLPTDWLFLHHALLHPVTCQGPHSLAGILYVILIFFSTCSGSVPAHLPYELVCTYVGNLEEGPATMRHTAKNKLCYFSEVFPTTA